MANLKIETMPIGDLTPYHRNPRRGNMAAIAESLKARGQYKPIVVNKGTKTGIANEILAGNHTWQAAKSLGWTTIEAVIVDLDADQAAQIVLADRREARAQRAQRPRRCASGAEEAVYEARPNLEAR